MPCDIVRLPCGSMSTHKTRCPVSAKAAARFSVVVVFATPPFWLAKAITLARVTSCSDRRGNPYGDPRSRPMARFLPGGASTRLSGTHRVMAAAARDRGLGHRVDDGVVARAHDAD